MESSLLSREALADNLGVLWVWVGGSVVCVKWLEHTWGVGGDFTGVDNFSFSART